VLTLLFTVLLAPAPQLPAPGFLDFADDLGRRNVAVVAGTLARISEGRRERMKEGDGRLGEGTAVLDVAGTAFHRVQAAARLQALTVHAGEVKERESLAVAFELQAAVKPDGTKTRHFLLTPRVACEDGMLGLFVLEKEGARGGWRVAKVLRAGTGARAEPAAAFLQRCADVVALNRRMHALREAIEAAKRLREAKDDAAAAQALEQALAGEPELQREDSQPLRAQHVAPLERRARELLGKLPPQKK
jgi:hypothetical protein